MQLLISPREMMGRVLSDAPGDIAPRTVTIFSLLVLFNIVAWAAALVAFGSHPLLLGTAVLAFTFGLRHAVDADHISAIDNVTRKLMQEQKRPVAVGLFFSLGHSTIVVALSLAVALGASIVTARLPNLQHLGGLVGTSVSALFLLAIALINALVLAGILQMLHRVHKGEAFRDRSLDEFLARRGVMSRFFQPSLRMIRSSWQMYPIGLLFGLGFDTATEVAVLGIAAIEGARGLPIYAILIFPLLFTAGMSLLDTVDGTLMIGAYGWAFARPVAKLKYNLTITLISVLTALLVGSIEALSVIGSQFNLNGWFWRQVGDLNGSFGAIGFSIITVFMLSWASCALVDKLLGHDTLEARPDEG